VRVGSGRGGMGATTAAQTAQCGTVSAQMGNMLWCVGVGGGRRRGGGLMRLKRLGSSAIWLLRREHGGQRLDLGRGSTPPCPDAHRL
jgi:hypothetical protein